ncbi:MAG TPA: glycosyltransferase [Frankiaceae bacterium]|jgi:glycosyltransferase involved in cell wall biosynthesis|nr:glycosyltransferase [Frankiaceae bacterium]
MRRAAVYNRFWHSMGGGERHSGKIAEVLAADGWHVDLIGHTDVGRDSLADHLGLDLSGTTLRVVPDKGDAALVELSEEYDLFVNATFMSRLAPRAKRNVYLCYFPTPFDYNVERWRQVVLRHVAPRIARGLPDHLTHGLGWYPPEGGLRRSWVWSQGDGVVVIPRGRRKKVSMLLGRPGGDPVELTLRDGEGTVLARVTVTPDFRKHTFDLGAGTDGMELHFVSETFTPAVNDNRDLGVAVSRLRLVDGDGGMRWYVVHRLPWLTLDPTDLSFLESYDEVLANSEYTRGWIQKLWKRDAAVLFPPIRINDLEPSATRTTSIVTVGRFFRPGLGHAKRQLEMVRMFGEMYRAGGLEGWTLHVVGGCEPSQVPYLEEVRAAGAGLPVELHPNAPRSEVERLLDEASVFWSATGFGENEDKAPWAMEHFGMTTVEAMAGGCVPVVIDRAGQREIVRHDVDGFRWSTPAELAQYTRMIASDDALRARLAGSAVKRAAAFSEDAFAERWREIAKDLGLG